MRGVRLDERDDGEVSIVSPASFLLAYAYVTRQTGEKVQKRPPYTPLTAASVCTNERKEATCLTGFAVCSRQGLV